MRYVEPASMEDGVRKLWADCKYTIRIYENRIEWVHTFRVAGMIEDPDATAMFIPTLVTFKCCRIVRDFWILYAVMWKDVIIDVLDAIPRGDKGTISDDLQSTSKYRDAVLSGMADDSELLHDEFPLQQKQTTIYVCNRGSSSPEFPTFDSL